MLIDGQLVCDCCGSDDPRYRERQSLDKKPSLYCELCVRRHGMREHGEASALLDALASWVEQARGVGLTDAELRQALEYLLANQNPDGLVVTILGPDWETAKPWMRRYVAAEPAVA